MHKDKIAFLATIGLVCTALSQLRSDDPMQQFKVGPLTAYQASHFLMYLLVGYVDFLGVEEVIGASILWKLFEFGFGKASGQEMYWTSGGADGQFKDIGFNMSGYILGVWLSSKFPCRLNNCQRKLIRGYGSSALAVVLIGYLRKYT
ncbi:unnamed protein product [Sphacelaria rigidula]